MQGRVALGCQRGVRIRRLGARPDEVEPRPLWPQALALLGWGLAILTLATLRLTKRLS